MNYITKTEAFAHHGATLTAPRGVWAKKSDDGKFVVLAAWRKGFNRDPFLPGKASYTFGDGSPNPTSNRGRKEFIELMNWAIENCEGMIKAVVSEAQDWDHHPHDSWAASRSSARRSRSSTSSRRAPASSWPR